MTLFVRHRALGVSDKTAVTLANGGSTGLRGGEGEGGSERERLKKRGRDWGRNKGGGNLKCSPAVSDLSSSAARYEWTIALTAGLRKEASDVVQTNSSDNISVKLVHEVVLVPVWWFITSVNRACVHSSAAV